MLTLLQTKPNYNAVRRGILRFSRAGKRQNNALCHSVKVAINLENTIFFKKDSLESSYLANPIRSEVQICICIANCRHSGSLTLTCPICCKFQVYIFHVAAHPMHTWYTQCVTFGSFPSEAWEKAYLIFGMVMIYFLPLVVIVVTYSIILFTIYQKSRPGKPFRKTNCPESKLA